ncbi:hypothetical protein GCM10009639_54680 [Kitasatospora putterlickiae]|uniref:Uncharacterized protein n=1 Tax=Kitasatospora putterlickiae TaxID=221725 RepID=A0ABN1YFZ2_9ACTN
MSTTFADLREACGTLTFRQADGYRLDRWNALSTSPAESYDERPRGINRCSWTRRVTYEWVRPGQGDKHPYRDGY